MIGLCLCCQLSIRQLLLLLLPLLLPMQQLLWGVIVFQAPSARCAIAFFCHQHCDAQDSFAGAAVMLRSLIAQVALSLDLSFLVEEQLHTIATQDVSTLRDLIAKVVKRAPVKSVVCMIDGVDFLSNQLHVYWVEEVLRFLNSLLGVVAGSRSDLMFKILVTTPRSESSIAMVSLSGGATHA
ncbi:hypothetical protein BO82DRAFT_370188 [Aspergillus uvarum CBS 121591]|uniref:Nephrocystin 3-like N-terminal domain-containing protein n=1 Tax=Aspergillus uvarum CBS 121591 TaxID=1448315 RepID=A0A319D631_9EURO|nr:hypothetical protein BO82DRAFT_370188 [Aspergillus uvarum CBS 121591]PYH75482.1 hypothetical protein BO82DRAFT_370188 [Aspergillus uvarum CBS 121591]